MLHFLLTQALPATPNTIIHIVLSAALTIIGFAIAAFGITNGRPLKNKTERTKDIHDNNLGIPMSILYVATFILGMTICFLGIIPLLFLTGLFNQ